MHSVKYIYQISLHIHAVWSVFIVHMKKFCILGYPKCAQWRFWLECQCVQVDLNLPWTHMFKGMLSEVAVTDVVFVIRVLQRYSQAFDWITSHRNKLCTCCLSNFDGHHFLFFIASFTGMGSFRINPDFRIENFQFKNEIWLLRLFTRPSFCVKSS